MTDPIPSPEFEEKIRLATSAPAPEPAFVDGLRSRLVARADERKPQHNRFFPRPAWQWALGVLAILLIAFLAVGPQRVVAAMQRLLGYIPGVGFVEQGSPLRVLLEPVSQTRDGITLTVKQAVLSMDKTVVVFSLEGVEWDMLSHDENVHGCFGMAGIRLPDGTVLQMSEGGGSTLESRFVYGPIPADVNQATLTLPCISETLPGKAPEDWEVPLHFVPAPPEMTVIPVIQLEPDSTPTRPGENAEPVPVVLQNVIQIGDRTILLGTFNFESSAEGWYTPTGWTITDANGQEVFYTMPSEDDLPHYDWGFEINSGTTAFPITMNFTGMHTLRVDPQARAEFEFDAGPNPEPGQEWQVNQNFTLAGHTFQLVSIMADSREGYSFFFHSEEPGLGVSVSIEGYTPNGGGGGGGGPMNDWSVGQSYAALPAGRLKVILSDLTAVDRSESWQIQWSPEDEPAKTALYGITLKLDQYIPLEEGYYLLGHTEWTDARITAASPGDWALRAYDANGQEVPVEPADWQAAGLVPEPGQWLYKVFGTNFTPPLTLRATLMNVTFEQPIKLTFDLRPYGFDFSEEQVGLGWKTGLIPLDIPGILANAFKATYVKQGDLAGFEIAIQAEPALQGLEFNVESGLDTEGMAGVRGGGGSNRDEATGLLLATVLTDARITFPLVLSAGSATINGTWETIWTAPVGDSKGMPVAIPQACLMLDGWKGIHSSATALPAGLTGRLLTMRGALAPQPSLFLSDLDGSGTRGLVFGNGSLSPDGRRMVYSDSSNTVHILDLVTGVDTTFDSALVQARQVAWSPDGRFIAYDRLVNGYHVYVMGEDGKNIRQLTFDSGMQFLEGWTPDGEQVLVSSLEGDGTLLMLVNVETGVAADLFTVASKGAAGAAISPDGRWVAFTDRVVGRLVGGVFISRLDGSERRLIAQLDYWPAFAPAWSPDGQWLAISILDNDTYQSINPAVALVNVSTCEGIPLNGVEGEVRSWVP